ncbi:GNAT family N-acetyltransferase [Paracoccus saliphilus]|uniref:Acetyltransferase n=1 Tax=Paracoccus saliphilus TaxID=405559 RepID=A0AA45W281_9RHOB|nr:GNAT family N-acetyltransferase [Paracoccus saliphilus]WCR01871.1 GNAT family N-acetyltransferase [Paracoccus saliphilus]SIS64436.1 putative acetyltransferase [Paracoccus saliphilus]
MSCACGHHHPRHDHGGEGAAIALARPMIALSGRLICADTAQMMTALSLLPDHVELSRAEPGCLRFDIWQDDDPMLWHLSEVFTDADAFAAHQARAGSSEWGRKSADIERDFHKREIHPVIRPELPSDRDAIDALLRATFGGGDEARLVAELRRQGDLSLSLVAEAAGAVIGYLGLSPLAGDTEAVALAPVAVTSKAQGLGIGGALVHEALGWAGETPMVVLGDPAYYSRFGFAPAELDSPYAGPHLQLHGKLAAGSKIRHASAFSML